MLGRLTRWLREQHRIPGAGEFMETLSLTLFWGTILNMLMNAGTFYFTTLREVAPWFDFPKFAAAIMVMVAVAFVFTYKFVAPSIWGFRGRMIAGDGVRNARDSKVREDTAAAHSQILERVTTYMEVIHELSAPEPKYDPPNPEGERRSIHAAARAALELVHRETEKGPTTEIVTSRHS